MGIGCPTVTSTKAKCNTRSSTISELVAVDEMLLQILWTRLFMKLQGIEVLDNIFYQDNKSAILLEKMEECLVLSGQSTSKSGTIMLPIVLQKEI